MVLQSMYRHTKLFQRFLHYGRNDKEDTLEMVEVIIRHISPQKPFSNAQPQNISNQRVRWFLVSNVPPKNEGCAEPIPRLSVAKIQISEQTTK